MRILNLLFILFISVPAISQVYPHTTVSGNIEIRPEKQNRFLNSSFLFEKSEPNYYSVKSYNIKNQKDTVHIKQPQECFSSVRLEGIHVSLLPQSKQEKIIHQSKKNITLEDMYWCGTHEHEESYTYLMDLKYNRKHQLTSILQKYKEQENQCASEENIEWKYSYKRGKITKVNIHNKWFIHQIYDSDGKILMKIFHGNTHFSPNNFREKYFDTVKSYLEDEKKIRDLSSLLYEENLNVRQLIFYTYKKDLLTEVLSYDETHGFLYQTSLKYNLADQLTDFAILSNSLWGLQTHFIYDEKTNLLKRKLERRTSNCYDRGCSEVEMIENYFYDEQKRMVKVDYLYGNYSLNGTSKWPSTALFHRISYN